MKDFSRLLTTQTEGKRTLVIASTEGEARDGDIIEAKSWKLDNYRRNPVVLFNHDSWRLPIGKAEAKLEGDKLVAEIMWDLGDPVGAEVARKFEEGFLNAVSVRWRPGKLVRRDQLPKESPYYSERGGYLHQQSDLLEISAVTIPADPKAIATKRAIDGLREMVREEVERQLNPSVDELFEVRGGDEPEQSASFPSVSLESLFGEGDV